MIKKLTTEQLTKLSRNIQQIANNTQDRLTRQYLTYCANQIQTEITEREQGKY